MSSQYPGSDVSWRFAVFACRVVRLCVVAGAVCVGSTGAWAQKPDLHGTGAQPSTIANHATTTVTKDGVRLANTTISADGACRLVSYTTKDELITMQFEADRAPNSDDHCNYHVTNRYGSASSWIVVDYTDDEQRQVDAQQRAAGEKKASEVKGRSGSEWTLHLSDGTTLRYRLKPGEGEPGVAVFADDKGHQMKILVADDATVLFIPAEGGCYLTGKLVNGRVTNGTSGQACTPGGSWNAEMQ